MTVVKPALPDVAPFLFSRSAASFLGDRVPPAKVASAELDARAQFQARGLEIACWDLDGVILSPAQPVPINPRKFVKDYVPEREVVEDLSPWLIVTRPAVESPEFSAWKRRSARCLLGALVNTALSEQDSVWLQSSGPPMFRIRVDDAILPDAWESLTTGAEWVFLSGSDVEVRHLIFASELARAQRQEAALPIIASQALEAARTTYEAHVQSASRETLKALSDLRKTVIEETQKVTQRAQDLTSGLWRDVAISAAPFILKLLGDASKAPKPQVAAGLYFGAALFVGVSFGLQWRINSAFLENQKKARGRWLETIYCYISAVERKDIAEEPIERAVDSYRETRNVVGVIYLALIAILVWFGTATLRDSATAAVPSETSSQSLQKEGSEAPRSNSPAPSTGKDVKESVVKPSALEGSPPPKGEIVGQPVRSDVPGPAK